MRWHYKIPLRLRSVFSKRRLDSELAEEIRYHLDRLTEANLAAGIEPREARLAALRLMGGVEQIKEECRDMRRVNTIENLLQDLRFAVRQLRRAPAFTAVALLTLALGIGANTAIFSLVSAVVLRPLPYPHPEALVWIAERIPAFKAELAGGGDYVDWKDFNRSLQSIAAYDDAASFNMNGRGTPARISAARVSAGLFGTLGVEPALGRGFTQAEDQPGGPHAVVLTHAFWQQYFGSDPRALGQTIVLDSIPYTIVGVMPAAFRFPGGAEAQMFLPLALDEARERLRGRQQLVRIVGRLKPGVTLAQARADLDTIRKRAHPPAMGGPGPMGAGAPGPGFVISQRPVGGGAPGGGAAPAGASPDVAFGPPPGAPPEVRHGARVAAGGLPEPAGGPAIALRGQPAPGPGAPGPGAMRRAFSGPPESELIAVPLAEHLAGSLRPAILTLLGVVALVLLIACANVANLMLTRASTRSREIAMRATFGATRGRLVLQLLAESLTLSCLGGAAGLLFAFWGVRLINGLVPPALAGAILTVNPARIDWRVLGFVFAVSLVTGLVFGLAPALAATGLDLAENMKESPQAGSEGRRRSWLRTALALAELSLALVLLAGAGLLIKSFYRVLSVSPGFATERILTMNLNLTGSRYSSPAQSSAFFSELLSRAEGLPGVRSAALADSLPLSPYRIRLMLATERLGRASGTAEANNVFLSRLSVTPSYFYTLGIPLVAGRSFTAADDAQAAPVAVVNQALAQRLWPGENPIGKSLPLPGAPFTVVGVVGNTRHEGPAQEIESEIYVPFLQQPAGSMQLALRSEVAPSALVPAVRRLVASLDAQLPVYNVSTLEDKLSASVAPRRFNMMLLVLFAALALTLAAVGVYGVIAYSVSRRTHEIGVRIALGASRRDVVNLIVVEGLKLVLASLAAGLAGAFILTRFLAGMLFGVAPADPFTFAAAALTLAATALAACLVPALRATRVDPIVALRYE